MEQEKIITDVFESPTQDEWDRYLSSHIFDKMLIDTSYITCSKDITSIIAFELIKSDIQAHNNMIGSIKISYCLSKHYFNKGIPDDEWFISPGHDGSSVEYMPHFSPDDYLTRYWFSFYTENLYGKLFTSLDSLYHIVNDYYELQVPKKFGYIKNILSKIENTHSELYAILSSVKDNPIYNKASEYRNDIIHGISPSEVKNEIVIKRNVEAEEMKADDTGLISPQKKLARLVISGRIGDYVTTKELMNAVDKLIEYLGDVISESINIISKEPFSVKI